MNAACTASTALVLHLVLNTLSLSNLYRLTNICKVIEVAGGKKSPEQETSYMLEIHSQDEMSQDEI